MIWFIPYASETQPVPLDGFPAGAMAHVGPVAGAPGMEVALLVVRDGILAHAWYALGTDGDEALAVLVGIAGRRFDDRAAPRGGALNDQLPRLDEVPSRFVLAVDG